MRAATRTTTCHVNTSYDEDNTFHVDEDDKNNNACHINNEDEDGVYHIDDDEGGRQGRHATSGQQAQHATSRTARVACHVDNARAACHVEDNKGGMPRQRQRGRHAMSRRRTATCALLMPSHVDKLYFYVIPLSFPPFCTNNYDIYLNLLLYLLPPEKPVWDRLRTGLNHNWFRPVLGPLKTG